MSSRHYTPSSTIALPRLNARYAYVLLSQILNAASEQKARLEASGQSFPVFLERARCRLEAATQALGLVLQLAPPAEASVTREADQAFDNAWGGLYDFLSSCLKLKAGINPDPDGTRALMAFLFPEGTAFLKEKYLSEWQESQARLDSLTNPGNPSYLETLMRLGGQLHLVNIQETHRALGAAIGMSPVPSIEASSQLKTAFDQALSAAKVYVAKVVAWPDPEEPDSQALADALLVPLVIWEDYQTSASASSASAGEAGSSAAASQPS